METLSPTPACEPRSPATYRFYQPPLEMLKSSTQRGLVSTFYQPPLEITLDSRNGSREQTGWRNAGRRTCCMQNEEDVTPHN